MAEQLPIHSNSSIRVHMRMYANVCIYVGARRYIDTHTQKYVYIYISIYTYIYVYTLYVYAYIYVYV